MSRAARGSLGDRRSGVVARGGSEGENGAPVAGCMGFPTDPGHCPRTSTRSEPGSAALRNGFRDAAVASPARTADRRGGSWRLGAPECGIARPRSITPVSFARTPSQDHPGVVMEIRFPRTLFRHSSRLPELRCATMPAVWDRSIGVIGRFGWPRRLSLTGRFDYDPGFRGMRGPGRRDFRSSLPGCSLFCHPISRSIIARFP